MLNENIPHPQDASRILKLNSGREIGLAEFGADDGFPVLALHGAPASRIMFDVAHNTAKRLQLKLYCPDRPGYGLSPADGTETLSSQANDLIEIVDELGLTTFALLAVSGGAPYAMALLNKMSDRISQTLLVSPMGPIADLIASNKNIPIARGHRWFFLNLPRHRYILKTICQITATLFMLAPQTFARLFPIWLSRSDRKVLSQPHVRDSIIRMTKEALRNSVEGGILDLETYSNSWGIDLSDLDVPVQIWQGTQDKIVPSAVSFELGRLLPRANVTRIKEGGHFWVYDHIEDVLTTINSDRSAKTGTIT